MQKCKLCNSKDFTFLFNEKIINKYCCNFYECNNCRLIQTEEVDVSRLVRVFVNNRDDLKRSVK